MFSSRQAFIEKQHSHLKVSFNICSPVQWGLCLFRHTFVGCHAQQNATRWHIHGTFTCPLRGARSSYFAQKQPFHSR